MPRLGGRILGERLQADQPALRVLYMSGFTGGDSALQLEIEAAGLPFLQKPFTPAALARKVRDVLDGEKQLRD
jgi:two-component system cell cycle sensor histidine kinase/response regulator CckA